MPKSALEKFSVGFLKSPIGKTIARIGLANGMSGEYLKGPKLDQARSDYAGLLEGSVLQLGPGTGRDLNYFPGDRVTRVVAIDMYPSEQCLDTANRAGLDFHLFQGDLDNPRAFKQLEGEQFDCVFISMTGCLLKDPVATLAMASHSLKMGGRLILLEHGLSHDPEIQADQLDPQFSANWAEAAHGCVLTNDWGSIVEQAGFVIESYEEREVDGLAPFQNPLYCIEAVKAIESINVLN